MVVEQSGSIEEEFSRAAEQSYMVAELLDNSKIALQNNFKSR
jgi:hypothetical protein